jgi:two-component system, NarL family, invasion response regulator UvrY
MNPVVLTDERREGDTADTSAPADVGVMIVDDQAPFRAVARTVVDLAAGFTVVGEAASGEEAVELAASLHPALVLMDINLPGINGIEATRQIVAADPDTVVIMLSTYRADDLPSDAADCGAARYVHKEDFGPAVLREIWADRIS